MKTKKKLKKYLKVLKNEKSEICYEMELDYKVLRCKLYDSFEWEMKFRKVVKLVKVKKRFRRELARRLGVKYSEIKNLLPVSLNSTLIANYLNPHLNFYTHEEIRAVCQELKLEFDEFP